MSFLSRFMLLSRRTFPIPVKTANIHSIQSKSTLKKPWRDWEWNFYTVGIPTGLRVRMWNKVRCDMRTWNVSWITSMFERGRGRLVGAEREWYSNDSKISTAFEESEKNQSNISIEDWRIRNNFADDKCMPMLNIQKSPGGKSIECTNKLCLSIAWRKRWVYKKWWNIYQTLKVFIVQGRSSNS